MATWVKRK